MKSLSLSLLEGEVFLYSRFLAHTLEGDKEKPLTESSTVDVRARALVLRGPELER
jgi:hypothetical protein